MPFAADANSWWKTPCFATRPWCSDDKCPVGDEGVPPVTIQKLAGHVHLSTTLRYMHVVKGAEEAAIAELNAPLP
jgi:integrase